MAQVALEDFAGRLHGDRGIEQRIGPHAAADFKDVAPKIGRTIHALVDEIVSLEKRLLESSTEFRKLYGEARREADESRAAVTRALETTRKTQEAASGHVTAILAMQADLIALMKGGDLSVKAAREIAESFTAKSVRG